VEFNVLPVAFSTVVIGGLMVVGLSFVAAGRVIQRDKVGAESASDVPNAGGRGYSGLSRVMTPNHDYQRLRGVAEGTSEEDIDEGVDELVFETNQV
jgi:hypothetical protein